MHFNSLQFLLFVLGSIVGYRLAPNRLRPLFLLLANCYYLCCFAGEIVELTPLVGMLGAGYAITAFARPSLRKTFLFLLVSSFIFLFVYLKKYSLLAGVPFLGFPYVEVGMSYIFFRVMHLILDRASGAIKERLGVVDYLNYICFFPALISGPIQLWQDYVACRSTGPLSEKVVSGAVSRIATGYIKVYALSALLFQWYDANGVRWVRSLTSEPTDSLALGFFVSRVQEFYQGEPAALALWIAVVSTAFFVYVYLNFSGCMDIVIGVAKLMGFSLPENFDRPFLAVSAIDFWNRWHITLSQWFKLYVFNTMLKGMVRRWNSPARIPYLGVVAYFVTFVLLGIWHGRTFMFVMLGLLLGAGVSINKLFQVQITAKIGRKRYKALAANWVYKALCRGMTFSYISLTLTCMWMSANEALVVFAKSFPIVFLFAWVGLTLVSGVALQGWAMFGNWLGQTSFMCGAWREGFYARNSWLVLKAFFYSLVAIQAVQSQTFLYQGY